MKFANWSWKDSKICHTLTIFFFFDKLCIFSLSFAKNRIYRQCFNEFCTSPAILWQNLCFIHNLLMKYKFFLWSFAKVEFFLQSYDEFVFHLRSFDKIRVLFVILLQNLRFIGDSVTKLAFYLRSFGAISFFSPIHYDKIDFSCDCQNWQYFPIILLCLNFHNDDRFFQFEKIYRITLEFANWSQK